MHTCGDIFEDIVTCGLTSNHKPQAGTLAWFGGGRIEWISKEHNKKKVICIYIYMLPGSACLSVC